MLANEFVMDEYDLENAGLGEMMPLQLWETTLDPETRLLKQLSVEDVAETNIVFSSLMGARVSKQ